MSFGTPWNDDNRSPRHAPGSRELAAEVRRAAEKLIADLEQAERLTGNWAREELADALVDAALSQCLSRLSATGCWGEENRLPSSELWSAAGRLLEVGSLQHHARSKPHGYAGDYEMLTRICEQSSCRHPLGRVFDRYFLRQAAPQAVRSRTWQTVAALVSHCMKRCGGYHAVSVGSGPAIELREAIGMLPGDRRAELRVTLLDLDPAALDCARHRIEPLLPSGALRCVRTNLARLAQTADRATILGSPDFLVCSGLFDYLDDDSATATLRLFWERLAGGGLLLVGNFAPHNPTRAYMEWIGNWYLTYRTAEQLTRLATRAEIPPEKFTVGCEQLGVDLFLIGTG